jgi:HlyD family secretion protein
MSISTDIITQLKHNTMMIPNAAVKYQGNEQYVQIMGANQIPINQVIQIGISNDTHTEIIKGCQEGDQVVTQVESQSTDNQFGGSSNRSQGSMMRMIR